MTDTRKPVHTGGCQCGAVRYALYAEPTNPHVCHCRMCQKAFGNYFAPFAGVPPEDFAWVKGTPGMFKSSEVGGARLLSRLRHAAVVPLRRQGPHLRVARQPRRSGPRGPGSNNTASRAGCLSWRRWPNCRECVRRTISLRRIWHD